MPTTVAGLFHSSFELEKAVTHLLSLQFDGTQLHVIPLRLAKTDGKPKGLLQWLMLGGFFGDTLHRSDGRSLMDGVAAGATLGGLIGVIMGAAVQQGPVLMVVVGITAGGLAGYLIDLVIRWRQRDRPRGKDDPKKRGTILEVRCTDDNQAALAERILVHNQAHALGRAL